VSLTPGTTVGRYEIRGLLGSGGMGEVYKAHDSTLGRSVALKVLRQDLSADAERVTRFLQEARAASALNHPNILTIHEVGDHHASRFIVSEFVDGETLRGRMQRRPLTLREILDVAIQTASALAAAHAAGIVHRDIKPENLMLRPDGYVKVLDFGVAKLAQSPLGSEAFATAATMAPATTGAGMVVGTMAYMAPEQARGLNVDSRADCFSLGIVLYELVTGQAPFAGPTPSDVLVAILDKEPPPLRLKAPGLPLQLEWMIAKALDKDPNLRYQSIADLRVDLVRLKAALESGRIAETSSASLFAPLVDQPLDVELTDDSVAVRAVSGMSWATVVMAVVAAASITAAISVYHLARPGADLPLQVPEGAVLTKARDAIESVGYTGWGPRHAMEFERALDVAHVTALGGPQAVREAVREGVVANWAVGFTHTRGPNVLVDETPDPRESEFAVRLDPRGEIVSFATGLSPEGVAPPAREPAIRLGLDTLRRVFSIDASAYEVEFIERAFPVGTVEMTWRNPTRRFGHIEQFRVHLQGERVVRLGRSFERPPGFKDPEATAVGRILSPIGGLAIAGASLAGWAFGLFVLFKTRNWDALRDRLPLAICAILVASVALSSIENSATWQALIGVIVVLVLLGGTVLPALSGVLLWIRRQTPGRPWAADQLARGRFLSPSVSVSLVDGATAGAAIAAADIFANFIGLRIEGYVPSISREVSAVENGLGAVMSEALSTASLVAIGIALAVEVLDRTRLPRLVSTLLIAAVVGVLNIGAHQTALAVIPPIVGYAVTAVIAIVVYRARGLLAVFIAAIVSELLIEAAAARSLDDPDLARLSNLVFSILVIPVALGIWGLVAARLKRASEIPASPASV